MLMLSVTIRLLAVEPSFNESELDFCNLLVFAAIMGFGGVFISLVMSKWLPRMKRWDLTLPSPQLFFEVFKGIFYENYYINRIGNCQCFG